MSGNRSSTDSHVVPIPVMSATRIGARRRQTSGTDETSASSSRPALNGS
jgi:hypothetical protein